MTVDIKQFLSMTPQNLAEQQHKALNKATIEKLKKVVRLIEEEKYTKVWDELFHSAAGDCYGSDNNCIDFSFTGNDDLGQVIELLENLKKMSEMVSNG